MSIVNGKTDYSASCDGHSYWGFEMVGEDDKITLFQNWVYYTSGRSPALSGGTLLHAANNVFSDNSGHLIEGGEAAARGIFEGNYFLSVETPIDGYAGLLFSSDPADLSECQSALGRDCVTNMMGSGTGDFSGYTDTTFFSDFNGLTIVDAVAASSIAKSVVADAGNTL